MKNLFRSLAVCSVLATLLIVSGCDQLKSTLNKNSGGTTNTLLRDDNSIAIASFNIQVFGQSKLKKKEAMDVLAKVVRHYDVVAIQEVRSTSQDVLPNFVKLINADGSRYDFVLGPRLGRTSSKEQYAYVYDTNRINFVAGSEYTAPNPGDQMHRAPFVASFQTKSSSAGQPFSFTLVNIHTDPDETKQELNALDDVFVYVQNRNRNEDDVILLGDLNVSEKKLGQLGQLPNIDWVVKGAPTNTRGSKSYDNIVFNKRTTVEYTGKSGVMNLLETFDLTMDEALQVSDHMPVWAVFSMQEGGAQVATRPGATAR
jgi:deoxyribonuclease-1-like protein